MDLSSQDLLRLNVLLAQDCEAIRIDESALAVYGLTRDTEAAVPLHPNCRPEHYLRRVREFLSSFALGSPGGYPVYLQRWTRMGQTKGSQLAKLLLLGEPEAVVAVAGAPDLTSELARRVWWCQPTSDNARRMLSRAAVTQSGFGAELAHYLIEHLPFETDPLTVITTIKLVLDTSLLDAPTRQRLWNRGTHRNAYHLGFLDASPDDLPDPRPGHPGDEMHRTDLEQLSAGGNALAGLLARVLSSRGQTFLAVSEEQMRHPLDKFATAHLFEVLQRYFGAAHPFINPCTNVAQAYAAARTAIEAPKGELKELLAAVPTLSREVEAVLGLGQAREALITPIIAQTTATGTLLRRKLEPVVTPLLAEYAVLRGEEVS